MITSGAGRRGSGSGNRPARTKRITPQSTFFERRCLGHTAKESPASYTPTLSEKRRSLDCPGIMNDGVSLGEIARLVSTRVLRPLSSISRRAEPCGGPVATVRLNHPMRSASSLNYDFRFSFRPTERFSRTLAHSSQPRGILRRGEHRRRLGRLPSANPSPAASAMFNAAPRPPSSR